MKRWTASAAMLALAVGGLLGGTPSVLAEETATADKDSLLVDCELQSVLDVSVMFRDATAVYLAVNVSADLAFKPATVSFGPEPYSGGVIASTVLMPGFNVVAVPATPTGGWFTVAVNGRVRTTEDETVGVN